MNLSQRRIINIFKSFIERVFVPQLSKMDTSCQQEWNKFSNMISSDILNIGEIQLYVDTLPGVGINQVKSNFQMMDNKQNSFFSKVRKQTSAQLNTNNNTFNPSKTFGGERARAMFPLKDPEEQPMDRQNYNFSKDFSKDKEEGNSGLSTQAVLPTLQRLFKLFSDNQMKLQKSGVGQLPTTYEHKNYYN